MARALVATVGALLALLLLAAPASADAEDAVVGYDMAIVLEADGTAHVTLDLDMDFGTEPNRGPFLTHVVTQWFDDTRDRVYRYSNIQVSSSTGAVDTVAVEENGGWLEIRIGEEDRDEFTGVHSYRITYEVEGWVNTVAFFGESTGLTEDEFYVNVIGDAWEVPLQDITVRVAGPADVVTGGCFAGYYGADDPCTTSSADGAKAVFTQDTLGAGEGMTVYVAYPAGTFDADPILQERWSVGRAFTATPARTGLAVVIGAVGTWLVLSRVRRRGRDEQYLGLTPGLAPAPGQAATVGARGRSPVTVQFTPPAGFRAGQLGTLVDERADPHDVTATIVDLAVRGYLVIQQTPPDDLGDADWRLIRTEQSATGLLPFEDTLLQLLFGDGRQVELSELATTFATSMVEVQGLLYDDVTARGWFRGNPASVRARWIGAGVVLLLAGVALTVLLAIWTTWALVGLPVAALGVLVMVVSRSAPARTADGTAVLAQAEGFRLYLATAEADQLRFEEGEDLFSRYLPYAVAFGLTERWAQVFADLAARGVDMPVPSWYLGTPGYGSFWASGAVFAHDLSSFTHIADAAISAPTPGSSGSSGGGGFSGGFSGGGGGGGGGGSW